MKILKHEEISPRGYRTMADVIAHLPHFLETIYNNNRQHSALLSVVQCLRGRSRPFPFIRSNHTLLIVQPRGSLHTGWGISGDHWQVASDHGGPRHIVERPGAGQAAVALNAGAFTTPALHTNALAARAHVRVMESSFAHLLGAKHTKKGTGGRRIRDPAPGYQLKCATEPIFIQAHR